MAIGSIDDVKVESRVAWFCYKGKISKINVFVKHFLLVK